MVEPDRDGPGPDAERTPGQKSPDAFRTISEVSTDLDIPQHVLRFWEGKFTQIRPLKRAGGRRYYRPDDVELLRGIQHLLYSEGYTIKGVQKILREQGVRHVVGAGRREDAPPRRGAAPSVADVTVEERGTSLDQAELDIELSPDAEVAILVPDKEIAGEAASDVAEEAEAAAPGHTEPDGQAAAETDEVVDPQAALDDALPDDDFEPVYASGPPPREPDARGRIEPTFDPLPLPPQSPPDADMDEDEEVTADFVPPGEIEAVPDAQPGSARAASERDVRARQLLADLEELRADYDRRRAAIRRSA